MTFKSAVNASIIAILLIAGVWLWPTATISRAPDAVFTTIKGQTLKLSELKGKPILITFWATDCPGCIKEIPHLISLQQRYAASGLTIVAIAMDYDPPNHVLAMADRMQLPYAVALDPDGGLAQAFGQVNVTPTTFLIDRDGNIALQKVGAFDPDTMQQRLDAL